MNDTDPTLAIERLRELVRVITSKNFDATQFYMSIPARPNHDADLVLQWAADRLTELESPVLPAETRTIIGNMQTAADKDILNSRDQQKLKVAIEYIERLAREKDSLELLLKMKPLPVDGCESCGHLQQRIAELESRADKCIVHIEKWYEPSEPWTTPDEIISILKPEKYGD